MRSQIRAHHSVAHSPSGHGISLRKAIQQNSTFLESILTDDRVVRALKNQPAVNLIGEHHDVAVGDDPSDVLHVTLAEHAAGWILGRIQDNQLGAIGDQFGQFVDIQAEVEFFAESKRYGFCAQEVHH